jgi:acyl dehydratase
MILEDRYYYEDLEPGVEYVSPGRTITESDLATFSGLTGDYSELHTNEEYMRGTEFGTRIAHGLLLLAIQSGLSLRAPNYRPSAAIAFLGVSWNFRKPVFIGDTVTVKFAVKDKRLTRKPGRGIVTVSRTILNQRGEVVQDGETVQLVMTRDAPTADNAADQ